MKPPIFIIGNPRSGTTLLRLMLTCHRNIVIPPECGFAVWLYPKYGQWSQLRKSEDHLLTEFLDDLMKCRKIETWNMDVEGLFGFLKRREPLTYSDVVSSVYEWYGLSQGENFVRWGDKNNFHIHHILSIKTIFPNACFIHIIRDGRDVACSYKKLSEQRIDVLYAPRLPGRLEDIAEQWKANIQTAVASFTIMGSETVYEIRFEDLILNTEASLRHLCEWLGEEYDPSMLDYYIANQERGLEPRDFLSWKQKTLRPPIPDESGRYLSELTIQEIHLFENIAGQVLEKYGYVVHSPNLASESTKLRETINRDG